MEDEEGEMGKELSKMMRRAKRWDAFCREMESDLMGGYDDVKSAIADTPL